MSKENPEYATLKAVLDALPQRYCRMTSFAMCTETKRVGLHIDGELIWLPAEQVATMGTAVLANGVDGALPIAVNKLVMGRPEPGGDFEIVAPQRGRFIFTQDELRALYERLRREVFEVDPMEILTIIESSTDPQIRVLKAEIDSIVSRMKEKFQPPKDKVN